jgi:hypothetical protein
MVIITGLGRCGTSILTKYYSLIGVSVGKNVNWHDIARAGMELSPAYSITHDIYHLFIKLGKSIDLNHEALGDYWSPLTYKEAILKVDKDDRQGNVELFKDPRLTWHPDIIRAWWSVRQDIKLIICHRKPEDVYKSRESLPIQYGDPKRRELIEYKIDFEEFFTTVLELGIPYKTLYFPNFLFNYEEVINIADHFKLTINHNGSRQIWDDLIELEKYI